MVTPDQARQMWCALARCSKAETLFKAGEGEQGDIEIPRGQAVANRVESADGQTFGLPMASMCIAEKCMMWRWVNASGSHGRCGLAGAVEFG